MKMKKLSEDEFCWRTIFKFRKSTNDFVIERKSSKHQKYNHDLWMSRETVEEFVKFVKEVKP